MFDQSTARNELTPSTSRTGVAAVLGARPVPWLLSTTSFTYARAVFAADGWGFHAGELLPYVPEVVVRSDLAFTPVLGTLFERRVKGEVGAGLTYLGRKPLPYGELAHDSEIIDATAALRVDPVELRLDAFNLLDTDWYDGEFVYASAFRGSESAIPVRHVTVGPPRIFLFTLSLFV